MRSRSTKAPPFATFVAALACASLAQGCGGGAPSKSAAIAVPAASASASADAGTSRRSASAAVSGRWIFGDTKRVAIYADLDGLFRAPRTDGLVPAVLALAKATVDEQQAHCIDDFVSSAKELAFGSGAEGDVLIIRFDEHVAKPTTCLAVAGAKPSHLDGATEAYRTSAGFVVHEPGLILFGSENAIAKALGGRPAPFPAEASLVTDQYISWSVHDEGVSGHGGVFSAPDHFRLDVDAEIPEELAKQVEDALAGLKSAKAPVFGLEDEELVSNIAGIARSIELTREGGHVRAAYELREPPSEQARDFAKSAAVALRAVRKYIANAKTAEARNAVGQIAKDIVTAWEREDPPGPKATKTNKKAKKKLASFPPVPQVVPSAQKYQSSASDWKPWAPIYFSIDMPQYFQYEVRAAKDGDSAEVLARGDLDGNGKTSLFRLRITVDHAHGDVLVIAPKLEETDPDE